MAWLSFAARIRRAVTCVGSETEGSGDGAASQMCLSRLESSSGTPHGPADDPSAALRRPEKDPGGGRTQHWEERTLARLGEAGGDLDLARSRRARIRIDGRTTEHYRSTSVDVALDMLVQLP